MSTPNPFYTRVGQSGYPEIFHDGSSSAGTDSFHGPAMYIYRGPGSYNKYWKKKWKPNHRQNRPIDIDIHYSSSVNGVASLHTEILKIYNQVVLLVVQPDRFAKRKSLLQYASRNGSRIDSLIMNIQL